MKTQISDAKATRLGKYILATYHQGEIQNLLDRMEMKTDQKIDWTIKPSMEFILNVILEETNVTMNQFISKSRNMEYVYARQAYCYLAARIHDRENLPYENNYKYTSKMRDGLRREISRYLPRDASMVTLNVKQVCNYIRYNTDTRQEMRYLEELIYTQFKAFLENGKSE